MRADYIDWGRVGYEEGYERQKVLVERRIAGEVGDMLVFVEHDAVYTYGRRKGTEANILWGDEELRSRGIGVSQTNRGGDVTYHGPGQVVGYSIVDISGKMDLRGYLRDLEEVLIRALRKMGLESGRREGWTGVWVGDRKIAAIGVAVRRMVTYHGFALNVDVDLGHFEGIVPCGIGKEIGGVTSLDEELGNHGLSKEEIKGMITLEFWNLFK